MKKRTWFSSLRIQRKQKAFLIVLFVVPLFFFLQWRAFFRAHQQTVPDFGGILTSSLVSGLGNINPLAPAPTLLDQDIRKLIHAGLLTYDPASETIVSGLAEFFISEDGKTYTLTIKDSARFSDGSHVTTDDVIFTFEQVIKNPHFQNKALQEIFEYVDIIATDERTVLFTLPEPNVFFSGALTTPILAHKQFEKALIEEITDPNFIGNKKPIGAGPFRLKNIVPNDDKSLRVFLDKNPYYYQGKPYIEKIVLYGFPSENHLKINHTWTTLFTGFDTSHLDKFTNNQDLEGRYKKREYLLPRWVGMFYNLDQPYTKNIHFRRALEMSIAKESALEEGWIPTSSPFFYEGLGGWQDIDPNKARTLLRDKGFPYNYDQETRTNGINGEPIELTFITSTTPPSFSRMAQSIVRTWESELYINVDLQILSPQEFQKALKEKAYDIVLFGQSFSQNYNSLSPWHTDEAGKTNLSYLTNDKIDVLIHEIQSTGAKSDLAKLNEEVLKLVPATTLGTPEYHILFSEDLHGFESGFGKVRSHSEIYAGIKDWYFEEKHTWDFPEDKSKFWEFLRWIFTRKSQTKNEAPEEVMFDPDMPFEPISDETN